jgi:hypothetical protein
MAVPFCSMESNTIRSSSPKSGYSATVEMFLDIGGVRHDVSHMGQSSSFSPSR